MTKYYLIKATPRIKDIIEFNKINQSNSCVELTDVDLKTIYLGATTFDLAFDCSNGERIIKKIRKVLE